uniref:ISAs1 family transposase n=1 Tax=Nocardia higoensis TaxID=228599 RepID=UPI001FDEFDBF|nr:ISAs1 family transposase [Nocardia higoensis]
MPGDRFDEVIGAWIWLRTGIVGGRRVIAFDGKTLRGAKDTAGNMIHLLAGLCQHTGTVLTQLAVNAKTNEISMLQTLLARTNITAAVITADAFNCQSQTAALICDRGGDYILTVKANQPNLRKPLKRLPWGDVPIANTTTTTGHGRRERRTLKATAIDTGIGFPGAERPCESPAPAPTARPANAAAKPSTPSPASPRPRHTRTDSPLFMRTLGNREPHPLGPRRHLRRRPLPDPHRPRTTSEGNPA